MAKVLLLLFVNPKPVTVQLFNQLAVPFAKAQALARLIALARDEGMLTTHQHARCYHLEWPYTASPHIISLLEPPQVAALPQKRY